MTITRPLVRASGGSAVIDLPEQMDGTTEQALSAAYAEAAAKDGGSVLLNFSGVEYINSTGIAVLVGLLARAMKEGRRLAAYGLSEHYREVFEVTRLSDFMTVHQDEARAKEANG